MENNFYKEEHRKKEKELKEMGQVALFSAETCYDRHLENLKKGDVESATEDLKSALEYLEVHIDTAESDNYRMMYAMVIQALQDMKQPVNEYHELKKLSIYAGFFGCCMQDTEDEIFENRLTDMYVKMGCMYLEGKEVKRDDAMAMDCFKIAAKRGSRTAIAAVNSLCGTADETPAVK